MIILRSVVAIVDRYVCLPILGAGESGGGWEPRSVSSPAAEQLSLVVNAADVCPFV